MTTEWVGIVANAHSGRGRGRERVEKLVKALERQGLAVEVAWTPDARSALVARSSDDPLCRCLVAAGGDGTLAALINEHPTRPVTVMPAGTENLFAQHFGMNRLPEDVAATIAHGRLASIDLGQTADRRFALMAGIGFDAEVVSRHHAARIGHAGSMRPTHRAAYVEPVLRASLGYKFPVLQIEADGPDGLAHLSGTTAFVFNLPRYALGLPIAPTALEDDGLLDLVVFRDAGPLRALRYLWMVFRGIHLKRDGVWHRKVARVSVTSSQSVPVQLDGDPGGMVSDPDRGSCWTASVLPSAVQVVVPSRYASVAVIA